MTRVTMRFPYIPKVLRRVLGMGLLVAGISSGQATSYERIISAPLADVQKIVRGLRPSSSGRLPTLDGFVQQGDQSLDRYARGYYECTFQLAPAVKGGTMVEAAAKITAWYTDPVLARSGYRILPSNGRLENDCLDRIQDAVSSGKAGEAENSTPGSGPATVLPASSAKRGSVRPVNGGLRPAATAANSAASSLGESSSREFSSSEAAADDSGSTGTTVKPGLPAAESLEALKARREADEKQAAGLTAYVKNLEQILHDQVRPADLVSVKRDKMPVLAKPEEGARVLFSAEAEDEFQILSVEGPWVRVRISGVSRGWVRGAQVNLPPGYRAIENVTGDKPAPRPALFKVNKEETNTFTGNWPALKEKTVRVEWVEPASPSSSTSAKEKLDFAKSLFLKTDKDLSAKSQMVEGIVIVFDSADGGQIAAPIGSVAALSEGTLSTANFWKQCSLDPPESFGATSEKRE